MSQAQLDQAKNKHVRPAGGWTISEYAALKRVHPVTVKRWIKRGAVEVERITRRSIRILGVRR